ncbi:MAG: UvrD-helicase domain-containing protein [Gemmatimonadaceae bacterium]|nr:UvrD-helicase domain-containing protein [Gemmatimonadaceae bacterium]
MVSGLEIARSAAEGRAEPLAGLNDAQRLAVLHHEGPLLIIAGAGSGKTRVLTARIARLIQHHGVAPSRILAVTFTNKAAGEMRERISRQLGSNDSNALKGMWCGTFHALGARMLRAHAPLVGRTANFTIYDEDDSLGVIKRIMERAGLSPKQWTPKAIANLISDAKNALISPKEYEPLALDPLSKAAARVYSELEGVLRSANAVSFDDLLVLPVKMLRENQPVLEKYRDRFQFILVDEYQDTNGAQFQFIKLLGSGHGNVAVVGDDDQSIYGWRGADIRNILDFEKSFASATVVKLEDNYRSTPHILDVANAAISANIGRRGKTLRATRPGGDPVTMIATLDDRDEADWLIDEVKARRTRDGLPLNDFAVLYRTNAQSRSIEDALRRQGMPYRLIGAVRFYDRREIRDLMSYLKLVANPADDEAFRRAIGVPKRGIGDTSVDALSGIARGAGVSMFEASLREDLIASMRPAARAGFATFGEMVARSQERALLNSVDELLRDIIESIRYGDYLRSEGAETSRERIENVSALIDAAAETVVDDGGEVGLRPLDHFLQKAMLVAAVDGMSGDSDAITLMTLHNAKGLEFPVVFITGLEDGLFPLSQSFDQPEKLEEERRLFYVGITRAEKKLYMSHAESRRRNGELMISIPSRFLKEIPAELLEEKQTMRLRTSGRNAHRDTFDWGASSGATSGYRTSSRKQYEVPAYKMAQGWRQLPARDPDIDASQDEPLFVIGERVKHPKFGSGKIAHLTGTGHDIKVIIDFDDENYGRMTIKPSHTKLEKGID